MRPEILARAAIVPSTARTGFTSSSRATRVCRSVGSQFHFRPLSFPHLRAAHTRRPWRADAKRLLPPIVEGTERCRTALPWSAAAATGLKAGTPVVLGYVDVVCTGLGGGLFDPRARSAAPIVGSTGMHMRMAPTAADVRLNAETSGYTMAFPVPGMYAQMQSNMASTLNIDWLLDVGRDVLKREGSNARAAIYSKGIDEQILARPRGPLLYHPYISQAGERGPFHRAGGARAVHRS